MVDAMFDDCVPQKYLI